MTDKTPTAPTHLQINFYRLNYGRFEYLLLKRIDDTDDDFWQAVTAQLMPGSDIGTAVKRATVEQTGVTHIKRLSEEMYSYEWYTPSGKHGRDLVFAAELDQQTTVQIDQSMYSTYQWLPFDQALLLLKWRGAKDALKDLHAFLEAKKLSNPEYWQAPETGLYGQASDLNQPTPQVKPGEAPQPADNSGHNPYGSNVPKRLPDHPEESHERGDLQEEKEVNTGEWFL